MKFTKLAYRVSLPIVGLGLGLSFNATAATQFTALNLPPITLFAAACDPVNNTYVVGTFTNTVVIGGHSYSPYAGTTYLLAQYRPDGTVGWAIRFGTSATSTPEFNLSTTLTVTSNAVYVTGATGGSIHIVDTASNTVDTAFNSGNRAGASDGYLFRFSLTGVAVWQASITGTSAGDSGYGVALDAAGNVYWVGDFNGCCPFAGGATLTGGDGTSVALSSPSYGTAFLAKLSPAGTPLWVAKAYNRDVEFYNVAVDSQGNPYVVGNGTSWSSGTPTTVVNADGSSGAVSNQGTQSEFLIKFNTLGIMQWSASPVGLLDFSYYPLCMTTGDNVLFGGSYSSGPLTLPSTDGNNLQLAAPSGYDGFVAQYDVNGKAKWALQIPGTNDQHVVSICGVSSNVWVGGLTTGGIGLPGISLTPRGAQNIFILQTDTNGNVLSGSLLGGTGADALTSLQVAGSALGLIAGNEGGNFQGWGSEITNAGPFVLTAYASPQPPSITSQPQPVTVNAHANASFNVTATGTMPLSYQWSFNGTNISGATASSLTISNVTQQALGAYAVVITNGVRTVTSSNAMLTMYPFLASPFGGVVTDWGYNATLSVQAWGTGPLSYQWFDNGVALQNATNQTLTLTSIQFTNAGLYSVVVSSPLGSVTNTPEQVVVNPAGVSLGMYPGVTVTGTVGYTYAIQATADLSNTNSWTTVATLTLFQPIQLWVDFSVNALSPTNPHKYYRVVPGY